MMNRLLPWQMPRQYFCFGRDRLAFFLRKGETPPGSCTYREGRMESMESGDLKDLVSRGYRDSVPVGVWLHPDYFVFNILDFEKLARGAKLAEEMVTWRLRKVFPEDLEQYHHHFFRLTRNRVFSLLLRKDVEKQIYSLLGEAVVFLGSSTVTVMNRVWTGWSRRKSELLIEVDRGMVTALAQNRGTLYYIRKVRVHPGTDIPVELKRIVEFIESRYRRRVQRYLVVDHATDLDLSVFRHALEGKGLSGNVVTFREMWGG